MLPFSTPVALPVRVADLELHTVMDEAFYGSFTLSPQMHSHPYFEIIMSVAGCFSIDLLDGTSIVMQEGDLCVIPPESIHGTCPIDSSPEKLAVRFSYRKIKGEPCIFELLDGALAALSGPVHIHGEHSLSELLLTIRRELSASKLASQALVQALLQQFYIYVLRLLCHRAESRTPPAPPPEDSRISRYYTIEVWLADHYAEPVTENDAARKLGLSKRQLSRVLQDIYGMSFREKLVEIRLHNAVKLLTQSDCPIEKVAGLVGYTTPSGFYAAFRKRYGMSAGAYRKQYTLTSADT